MEPSQLPEEEVPAPPSGVRAVPIGRPIKAKDYAILKEKAKQEKPPTPGIAQEDS